MDDIKDQNIKLGSEFLGISEEEFKKRMEENALSSAKEWRKKKSIIDFYKTTDCYIYGLVDFNTSYRLHNLLHPIEGFNVKLKILDYGAGIGTIDSILAETHEVYYYDLDSKTKEFAKFINDKLQHKFIILDSEEEALNKKYDLIICTDVFEHLEDPIGTFKKLTDCLNSKSAILTTGLDFSTTQPMHLMSNINKRKEFNNYMNQNFYMIYFFKTPNELIYLLVKK